MADCLPPPAHSSPHHLAATHPPSISPHNLSPQSRIWLEWLSSRACLGFNKSLYQQQAEERRGVCVCTCKSFANMKSSKRNPLNAFCLKASAHSPSA